MMTTPISFPKFGLPASRARRLMYRLLRPVSPYYRGKAALQSCPLPIALALRGSILTRDGRLLFLKNPKAACSTVVQLIHLQEVGRVADVSRLHRTHELRQGHSHVEAHIAALDDPNCIRFTSVREPASRTVSAYMMFFSGAGADVFGDGGKEKRAARREAGMWALGYDPKGDVSRNFDVFLEYLARCFEIGPQYVNVHWKPQTLSIAFGHIQYSHIGRVETLKEDLETVNEMVGYPVFGNQREIPSVNRARRPAAFRPTSAQQRKIRQLYARDYENFGY